MKQETLPIVDCGAEILDALTRQHHDELEAKGCKFETYFHALKKMQDGEASSRREASRQTAEETGEHPAKVESEVRRAEAKIKQAMEAELARKEAESGECVTDDANGNIPEADTKPLEADEQEFSSGRRGTNERNIALTHKYNDEHLIQRYKEVYEMLELELPEGFDENVEEKRFSWIKNYVTDAMKEITRRGATGRRVPVDNFFWEHRHLRKQFELCWRCLGCKPASAKTGLCYVCAKKEAADRRSALAYAKIRDRGIDEKSTKAWNKVFSEIEVLVNKVDALLEQESPPRISQEQARLVIDAGEYLRNQLWKDDLLEIVNLDCYT
jgi:hypothetical protein